MRSDYDDPRGVLRRRRVLDFDPDPNCCFKKSSITSTLLGRYARLGYTSQAAVSKLVAATA